MESLHQPELFRCIQEYLTPKDFLAFMNISKSNFCPIKRQIIKYRLEFICSNVAEIVNDVVKFAEKVEIPNKQLSLYIEPVHNSFGPNFFEYLIRVASLLRSLYVYNLRKAEDVVDLSIFNNIPEVIIQIETTKYQMTKGLHNIQSLTLKIYTLAEIQRFNESHSLKEFTLEFCDDGGRFGVNELPLDTNYNEQFRIVYDERTKWLTRNKFPLRWSFKRQDSSSLLSLVHLKLCGDFSSTRLDLETIANIEDVELSHCDGSAGVASFPVFRGKKLRLYGFQLPLWTHDEEMARVEELSLADCTLKNNDRGDSFPSMPNARKLELQRVRNLRWLRTFPRAKFLRLYGLLLQYISPQPSLKELEIVCSATDCPSLDGQAFYSVQIISREIPEIAWARNSYKVSLQGYDHARNLSDLMLNSSLPLDRRECFISDMKNVDLSPLSNWRKVTVVDVRTFGDEHDRTRLSNIEELKISSCRNYLSTSNLHNIKRRLEISNCRSLTALKGLQHIPEVILTSLPGLTDFTGLGFHERVVVDDVPVLAQAAEQYAKAKRSGREEHVPHREIFGSIKSFTVLSKDGGGYTVSKTLW